MTESVIFMQLKIQNGRLELSGTEILGCVNIEINDSSRIAIVGRNGCGKTSLLKLISGEYSLTEHTGESGGIFTTSGKPTVGVLDQMVFDDEKRTLRDELRLAYSEIIALQDELRVAQQAMESDQSEESIRRYTALLDRFTLCGGFYFEREYEGALRRFGFTEEQKERPLSEFSGGQRTRIAFLKLLLSKPDILLLDEPTNHLDIDAVEWLEEYLRSYKKAFAVVSHDRMFLDNTVNTVYEIENGRTHCYPGNYSAFTVAKAERLEARQKEYDAQCREIKRLTELAEKFRYKPTKAAMAQSKLKQIERMKPVEAPEVASTRSFRAAMQPQDIGVKDVLSVEKLKIGYDEVLSEVSLEVKRGEHIGIIGGNGLGKSTFLKTLVGKIPPLGGRFRLAPRVSIGYFDQQTALYTSEKTVLEDFTDAFPGITDFEARSALGAFLFSGEQVFKTVNMLSGGERVRLALCKICMRRPNLLILDEPTNHMDIPGREALEELICDYSGTVLFVSHDRYFIKKTAHTLLSFEEDGVKHYPYGYDRYLAVNRQAEAPAPKKVTEQPAAHSPKKSFTTPLKERTRLERAVARSEEKIAMLEEKCNGLRAEMGLEENATDYLRLEELKSELEELEAELSAAMTVWETVSAEYEALCAE